MFSIKPSQFKALIPQIGGNFCEKFLRFITGFAQAFYTFYSEMVAESGDLTDNFKTMVCDLGCAGGGGGGEPNPEMPAPLHVMASDDAYDDQIRVTWDDVTGTDPAVTEYRIYRSIGTNSDPALASHVGTVAAPDLEFFDPVDDDLEIGVNYRYWVKSTNGVNTSAFSGSDLGRAAETVGSMTAISDLRCSQGFAILDGGPISLVWTPPTGASRYDVYRNTTNDFSTATKIQSDMVPQNTADHLISTQSPDEMWDNVGEIVLYHFPPSYTTHYFFWVVAKKTSPPAVSAESNSAEGWSRSFYAPYLDPAGAFKLDFSNPTATEGVEFNGTQIRVIVWGGGGGGAGGSQIWGGGGGGGGGLVIEEFTISPGDVLSLEFSPNVIETGNAAATVDGDAGSNTLFKINGVLKITAVAGLGGAFNGAGGGVGGDGGLGSSGTTSPTIHDGKEGMDGSGASGGRSGYSFGNKRYPAAHYAGYSGGGYDGNGSASIGGGGSYAAPGFEVLAEGGKGRSGYAVIIASGP